MQEFSNELMKLEDHPDRERILRMMDFAKQKPFFAHIICDAIWARLMDPKLPTSYKRPIFYLIDAIIVNAKGDFITFTREYLEQYYPTVLEVLSQTDREKLNFMFSTWEERGLFDVGLIRRLKEEVSRKSSTFSDVSLPQKRPIENPVVPQLLKASHPHYSNLPKAPALSFVPQKSAIFSNAPVIAEMQSVLSELLVGRTDSISLEDLEREQPEIFENIQTTAETRLRSRISQPKPSNINVASMFIVPNVNDLIQHNQESFPVETPSVVDQYSENGAHIVQGIINGSIVDLEVGILLRSADTLEALMEQASLTKEGSIMCSRLATRLKKYYHDIDDPFILPSILSGPLPLEPSKEYLQRISPVPVRKNASVSSESLSRKSSPSNTFASVVKALHESSLSANKANLIDAKSSKKGVLLKSREIRHRQILPPASSWVTAPIHAAVEENLVSEVASNDFVVLADEYFVRCPISKESFQKYWDNDERDFMYRNAVKVLISENGDASLYELGRPTSDPSVRYLIVRKSLIMDAWIQCGKALPFGDLLARFQSVPGQSELIAQLQHAASKEDPNKIFVILPNSLA